MATEILRPNAAGDETAITSQYPASTAHWDKVDEAVADDSATTVSEPGSSYKRDLYNLPAHSVGSGTINKITIFWRMSCTDGTWYSKPSQKSGTTVTDGTEQSAYADDGVFATVSQVYTTNPATGNAYTWDEIDGLQIGVCLKAPDETSYCTQVYVEVDYTAGEVFDGEAALSVAASIAALSTQVVPGLAAIIAAANAAGIPLRIQQASATIEAGSALDIIASEINRIFGQADLGITANVAALSTREQQSAVAIDSITRLFSGRQRIVHGINVVASVSVEVGGLVVDAACGVIAAASVALQHALVRPGASAMDISASVAGNADAILAGIAPITVALSQLSPADRTRFVASGISITALLEIIASEINLVRGAVEITSTVGVVTDGDLVAAGLVGVGVSAELTALQTLTASGRTDIIVTPTLALVQERIREVFAALAVVPTLTTSGTKVQEVVTSILAACAVISDAMRTRFVQADITVAAILEIIASEINLVRAWADLGIAASVDADANFIASGKVDLVAVAELALAQEALMSAALAIDILASVDAGDVRVRPAAAAILAAASLANLATRVRIASDTITVGASVSALQKLTATRGAAIVARAALTVAQNRTSGGAAAINAVVDVEAEGMAVSFVAAAVLVVAASLSAVAVRIRGGAAGVTVSVTLDAVAAAYFSETFGFTGNLLPGDIIEINCDRMTVKVNGVNMRHYWTGGFPKVGPRTTEIVYVDTELARTLEFEEEHDPRWL
jgi:hypothetical protein